MLFLLAALHFAPCDAVVRSRTGTNHASIAAHNVCRASRRAAFPAMLAPTIAKLSGMTFPVLVPSRFDDVTLTAKTKDLFVVATHARDRYRIRFDFAPGCNGANVCSAGAFSGYGPAAIVRGHVTNPPDGDLSTGPMKPTADERATAAVYDRPVKLANGSTAYYSEYHSGAGGGGNSSLRWTQNGVLYAIESRITTQTSLVATANSAIRNGPIGS